MKLVKEKLNRQGKREVTIVLEEKDRLMCFREDRFYKLGGQVDDIVAGHVVIDSECTYWCSISQEWVA